MITMTQYLLYAEPGLRNIWHESWPPRPQQHPDVFNIQSMSKMTETDAKQAGFGPMTQQDEGEQIIYQDPTTTLHKDYTYIVKATGYKVTDKFVRDELYAQNERFERDLMSTVSDDQEVAAFGLLNNAFTTTNTGFDGLQLCTTAHTRLDGGTNQANRPSTDVALSLSALHDAVIQFRKYLLRVRKLL